MGYFTDRKLHGAEVFDRGRFIVPGKYRLQIKGYKLQQSRKPGRQGEEFFIVSFKILDCSDVEPEPGKVGPKFRAGDDCVWNVPMRLAPSPSNVKKHFQAVFPDADPDSPDFDALCDAALDENICEGVILDATAYNVQTQKGDDHTVVEWTLVETE